MNMVKSIRCFSTNSDLGITCVSQIEHFCELTKQGIQPRIYPIIKVMHFCFNQQVTTPVHSVHGI